MKIHHLALASAAIVAAMPARAAVVLTDQNVPGSLSTVHLDSNSSANVVIGDVNGLQVVNIAGAEPITTSSQGNGQTWVVANDGTLNTLTFSLLSGYTFSEISFNLIPLGAQGNTPWTVTLNAISPNGAVTPQTFNIAGNNMFDAYTTDGWMLTSVTFNTATDLQGVGQIRIGSIAGPVPEPASWLMMVAGLGLLGATLRSRRTTSKLQLV